MNNNSSRRRFCNVNLFTVISLFVLILAGGVVRSSGSGMGCPDWPKCFGQYVPPTNSADLPKDYKQKYVAFRLKKNMKFARTLDLFGYSDLAVRIREDKSILIPEEFNVAKTWTEYINRLIGVIAGFGLLFSAVYSLAFWSANKWITFLSFFNLILVGFQGWLGSIVVSTNLVAWIVTVHLLLALAILAISIATYHMAKTLGRNKLAPKPLLYGFTFFVLLLSTAQIAFGSEVREKIDAVAGRLEGYREDWVSNAGAIFKQHRDVAAVVLVCNIILFALVRRSFGKHSIQQQLMSLTFLVIMAQVVTGIILSYMALPPFAQAAHIVLASLIFGAQFYLLLNLYKSTGMAGVKV
jgi:cytochrome c oxidase assembly protein subunit 15